MQQLVFLPVLRKNMRYIFWAVKYDRLKLQNSVWQQQINAGDSLRKKTVNVTLFFWGRKHSSGEQEPSTLPSPPLLSAADDRNQVSRKGLCLVICIFPACVFWAHFHQENNQNSICTSRLLTSAKSQFIPTQVVLDYYYFFFYQLPDLYIKIESDLTFPLQQKL